MYDELWGELLLRGVDDPYAAAEQLGRELDNPDYLRFVQDEYVRFFARALSLVGHCKPSWVRPTMFWPAFREEQRLALAIHAQRADELLTITGRGILRPMPTPEEGARGQIAAGRLDRFAQRMIYRAADEAIAFQHLSVEKAVRAVQDALGGPMRAVARVQASMRHDRRRRSARSEPTFPRRKGSPLRVSKEFQKTLLFRQLRTLHPNQLGPTLKNVGTSWETWASSTVPRKARPAPSDRAEALEMVPDELWKRVEPVLGRRRAARGPRGTNPRDILTGILVVLKYGIDWQSLPASLKCGSGATCLRRLRQWQRAGAWVQVEPTLAEHLPSVDLARCSCQTQVRRRTPRRHCTTR